MPDRLSRNFRQEYSFRYLEGLLLLCTFLFTINLTTLSFSVFDGFLENTDDDDDDDDDETFI